MVHTDYGPPIRTVNVHYDLQSFSVEDQGILLERLQMSVNIYRQTLCTKGYETTKTRVRDSES